MCCVVAVTETVEGIFFVTTEHPLSCSNNGWPACYGEMLQGETGVVPKGMARLRSCVEGEEATRTAVIILRNAYGHRNVIDRAVYVEDITSAKTRTGVAKNTHQFLQGERLIPDRKRQFDDRSE